MIFHFDHYLIKINGSRVKTIEDSRLINSKTSFPELLSRFHRVNYFRCTVLEIFL